MARPTLPRRSVEMITYTNLQGRANSGELVFRIHHPKSASPLVWTGSVASSGFSADQASFDGLSPPEYDQQTRHLRGGAAWMGEAETRNQVIDHVLDRRAVPAVPDPYTQDVEMMTASPFISVTVDLDWALYWIARQLAGTSVPAVHLAVIRRPTSYLTHRSGERRTDEVFVRPFSDDPQEVMKVMSGRDKSNYLAARREALEGSEWFFYGRVFGASIVADLVFTPTTLPFALPRKFWMPSRNRGNGRIGWLARLRWNPIDDLWKTAQEVIAEDRHALATGWAAVPTDVKQINMWPPAPANAPPTKIGQPAITTPHQPFRPSHLPPRPAFQAKMNQRHVPAVPYHARPPPPHFRLAYPYHQPFRPQRPQLHVPYQPRPPRPRPLPFQPLLHAHKQGMPPPRPQPHPVSIQPPAQDRAYNRPIQRPPPSASLPARPQIVSQALNQVNRHLKPIVNAHHGHRAEKQTTEEQPLQRPIIATEADLMGPEDFERTSLARAEAMLINLRL